MKLRAFILLLTYDIPMERDYKVLTRTEKNGLKMGTGAL